MKAVVAAFNQEKALVGAFSVITNLRMELFEALLTTLPPSGYSGDTLSDPLQEAAFEPPSIECGYTVDGR